MPAGAFSTYYSVQKRFVPTDFDIQKSPDEFEMRTQQ